MKAIYKKYILNFNKPSGTSRGVLHQKETWFLILEYENRIGIGECALFRGLSADDRDDYENALAWVCQHIDLGLTALLSKLQEFPSIQFGLEAAFASLASHDPFQLFPSEFTEGQDDIHINGLIWMGSKEAMKQQIKKRIDDGFSCIKLKIGAIDFKAELDLLKAIRKEFSAKDIELRVDANGAFNYSEALEKLKRLSDLELHSIEQPIKQGQFEHMAQLCSVTPLPIALDEELIGIMSTSKKTQLLQTIRPQYIILKPALVGGFAGSQEWINIAKSNAIGWWITSALESNVGLNAIAQWTYTLHSEMPQGLGTGSLFSNNFDSPLIVKNGTLHHLKNGTWNVNKLLE